MLKHLNQADVVLCDYDNDEAVNCNFVIVKLCIPSLLILF